MRWNVETSQGAVALVVQEGALGELEGLLADELKRGRVFLVSDENVVPLYAEEVAARLDAPVLALPAGEQSKTWSSVERVVRFLLGHGAERGDLLVAIGGGVVTDVAGFAAAVYMRGIRWVAVPTTLVGMVDAAIGGKTGIDLPEGKNLVGAFWQPRAVVADPLTLATLPARQVQAGVAEVLKVAMIAPSSLEHLWEEHGRNLVEGDFLAVAPLLAAAMKVKSEVVALDERDFGARAALNLGHTLAHALEAATGYDYFLHGEAVAWGLLLSLLLAQRRGLLASVEAARWAARLEVMAPLLRIPVSWEQVVEYLGRDKKRAFGAVRWVLPRLGGVVLGVEIPAEEVRACLEKLLEVPETGPFTSLFF